jgi:S1-C subfamily serine protease
MSGFPEDFPTLSRQIQSVADYLFGLTHQGEVIELSKIANETEIDSANAARLLRKMAAKEIIDIDGQNVRLMGLGVSLYEERCIPEFVLGLHFSLEKYRGAVVRIIVGKVEGGEAAGTGFFVSAPPNRIITNRHVVSGRTIIRIENERGESISTGPLQIELGPDDLDLAAIRYAAPSNVVPIPIDWRRDSARELDEVLVLSYPDIALTKPALYPATGKVGIVGDLLIGRKSLFISDVASAGSSGGPLISRKGKAIGVVAHEAESQGSGATRIFVGAIHSHYLGELFPPKEEGLSI